MDLIELEQSRYPEIKPLWEKLNKIHGKRSTHFKDHFAAFTFERRLGQFHQKEHQAIFAVMHEAVCSGYVMVSCENGRGEIDSIFVEDGLRCGGIGSALMKQALAWLDDRACSTIQVAVAEGNETAIAFYRAFGFFERFIVLQRKP